MKFGAPWQVSGVTRQTRQAAREAARRAGMSVGEWLDSVIAQSARADARETAEDEDEHAYFSAREYADREWDRRERHAQDDTDPEAGEHRHRLHRSRPQGGAEYDPAQRRVELEAALPFAREDVRIPVNKGFAELHARLDDLTRQLSQITAATPSPARSSARSYP